MATAGEKPGKGTYVCTECKLVVALNEDETVLPPCPKCKNSKCIRT